MKRTLIIAILIFFNAAAVWGSNGNKTAKVIEPEKVYLGEQKKIFRQSIPPIAKQFIGISYEFGGNPLQSDSSDNSHLFFSIYTLAAQKAGLFYKEYMPMRYLLHNINKVDENELKNGDLLVLNNDHAAMIYHVEKTGKIHLIYASEKRQQILSFNSDNPVFNVYWLENMKGFYRLSDAMLKQTN
jgi:hypothetical protein